MLCNSNIQQQFIRSIFNLLFSQFLFFCVVWILYISFSIKFFLFFYTNNNIYIIYSWGIKIYKGYLGLQNKKLTKNVSLLIRSNTLTVCYHVTYEFRSESILYSLPECQGTPCSKQVPYLKFKWQQWDSNPQPLSL